MRYGKRHPSNQPPEVPSVQERQRKAFRPVEADRRMWLKGQSMDVELHIGRTSENYESEAEYRGAENVGLLIKVGRHSVWLGLAAMTVDELDKFKQIMDQAYETARPVCAHLDAAAQRDLDAGETDLPARLFKLTPGLYTRGSLEAYLPPEPTTESNEDNTIGGGGRPASGRDDAPPGGQESSHDQGIQF